MEEITKMKEYLDRLITYEDKSNYWHPDNVDKWTEADLGMLKVGYRLLYDSVEFHRKNIATNYQLMVDSYEKSRKNKGK